MNSLSSLKDLPIESNSFGFFIPTKETISLLFLIESSVNKKMFGSLLIAFNTRLVFDRYWGPKEDNKEPFFFNSNTYHI